jgi:hypothetical protein
MLNCTENPEADQSGVSTSAGPSTLFVNKRSSSIGGKKSEYLVELDQWRKNNRAFREKFLSKPKPQPDPLKNLCLHSSMLNLWHPRLQTYNQQREFFANSSSQQNSAKSNRELNNQF